MSKQKAVGYIRVSREEQNELSPAKQIQAVKDWIKDKVWKRFAGNNNELFNTDLELDNRTPVLDHEKLPEITGFFYDEGTASDRKKIKNRKGLLALIKHCKKYKVKHIIFFTVSRLERGTTLYETILLKQMEQSADMEDFTIHVIAPKEEVVFRPLIDKEMNTDFKNKLIISEKRSLEIGMYSSAGKINSFERGLFVGRAPAGYKPKRGDQGKVQVYEFDAQAPIIRQLYELAMDPMKSVGDIHKASIDLGLKHTTGKKKGKPYQKESVRLMLINRGYTGRNKHPVTGSWHKAKGIPQLISDDTFNKVQQNLTKRNIKRNLNAPKYEPSALAKMFKCSHCDSMLTLEPQPRTLKDGTKKVHRYIRCNNGHYYTEGKHNYYLKRFGTKLCIQKRTTEDKLWKMVDSEVQSLYLNDEIGTYIAQEMKATKAVLLQEIDAEQKRIKRDLEFDLQEKLDRIDEGFLERVFDAKEAKQKKERVKAQVAELEEQVKILERNKSSLQENTGKILELLKSLKTNYLNLNPSKKAELLELMTLELKKEDETLHIKWAEPFNVLRKLGKTKGSKNTAGKEISKGVQSQHAQLAAGFCV